MFGKMEGIDMRNVLITGFIALLLWNISAVAAPKADTIYHNGSILTMAGKKPAYVEALAVKDGKIVFAGSQGRRLEA